MGLYDCSTGLETAGGPQEASQEERGHIVIVVVGVRSASASVAR